MRWVTVLVVVVVLGLHGGALADVAVQNHVLAQRIRDPKSALADRHEAAAELAKRVGKESTAVMHAAMLVLTDDPKIRGPLIEAMIAVDALSFAAAAHVPTAKVLTAELARLLRRKKLEHVPVAKDCRVTGGTPRGATIECNASWCAPPCRQERVSVTLTTGKRWTLDDVQQSSSENGACGHCMLID